jgi:excisionase family DNA binding protein
MGFEDTIITNKMVPMMTVKEVSRLIHVHPNTLRRWSNRGVIQSYRINERGDRRFKQDDIAHLLSQLETNGYDLHKVEMVGR